MVTQGHSGSLTVTHGTKLRPMSMHHRGSIQISILSYHQWPCITNFTHSYSHSLRVTQGHSRSFMFTQSHSWYEVMTNVSAPPGFNLGHSIKLPPISLHPNGHSKSLMVTHGHSRSLMVQSYDQCLCTTGVQSRSQYYQVLSLDNTW